MKQRFHVVAVLGLLVTVMLLTGCDTSKQFYRNVAQATDYSPIRYSDIGLPELATEVSDSEDPRAGGHMRNNETLRVVRMADRDRPGQLPVQQTQQDFMAPVQAALFSAQTEFTAEQAKFYGPLSVMQMVEMGASAANLSGMALVNWRDGLRGYQKVKVQQSLDGAFPGQGTGLNGAWTAQDVEAALFALNYTADHSAASFTKLAHIWDAMQEFLYSP